MPNRKYIISPNQKIGRFTALERYPSEGRKGATWKCICECGGIRIVVESNLGRGSHASCGCGNRDATIATHTKHGMHKSTEYRIWHSMIGRCITPRHTNYKDYGARGITVCKRWRDSFINFYADMGPRPSSEHSLDRKNNNGNYEPDNCRWATRSQQANNKRSSRHYTFRDQTKTISEWAEVLHCNRVVMRYRLLNWNIERAILTPINYKPNSRWIRNVP